MEHRNPIWKILAAVGAVPYIVLILFVLYGMLWGSNYSIFPAEAGRVGFCWNVLALHDQLWPVYLICFPVLLCGLGGWFWSVYANDRNMVRLILFLLSLAPMTITIGAGILNSANGILYSGLMASPVQGTASIIPWTITFLWEYWYLHTAAVVIFPMSVMLPNFR